MLGSGFQKPGEVSPLDPEYVKLQREEVIKAHQDKVIALQKEIDSLVSRKNALESELKKAHAERVSALDREEARLKEKEHQLDLGHSILNDEWKAFEEERHAYESEMAKREKAAQNKIEQNGKLLDSVLKVEQAAKGASAKNEAESNRLAALKKQLDRERESLNELSSTLDERKRELIRTLEAVESKLSDIQSEQSKLLEIQSENASQVEEINQAKSGLEKSRREYDRVIEASNAKLEELKRHIDTELDIANDNKQLAAKFEGWERRLKIWEQALAQETAIRKHDLDEREARIKQLELKIGGS